MSEVPLIRPDWPAPARVMAVTTTRRGGVSSGRFESLNLGTGVPDAAHDVDENRSRLATAAGLPTQPCWLKQVHGNTVVDAGSQAGPPPEADAAIARRAGAVCAVLTADCLPAVFCDRFGSRVAVAHAGWRGLAVGVLENTVSAMTDNPYDLMAWLGPCIGQAAFEVGPEVRDQLCPGSPASDPAVRAGAGDRWHLDLRALARRRLEAAGVGWVGGIEDCTYSDPDRFFSHRRDGTCGRMATLIWLTA